MGEKSPIRQIGILPLMILPMMKGHPVSIKTLQDMMEFDCAVRVGRDGTVARAENVRLPEVINSEGDLSSPEGTEWLALEGYSGQYSYHGPVMHSSEYIGGKLARDILSTPGIYVCLTVEGERDESCTDFCDDGPVGWIVATIDEDQGDNVVCHDAWCALIGCPNPSATV